MAIPDTLRALLNAHGPSGYETAPARVFADAASAFAEVSTDVMGSTWARVKGTGGGWDPQILVGPRVTLATRGGAVPGVIGKKPIDLLKDDERKKVARMDQLH